MYRGYTSIRVRLQRRQRAKRHFLEAPYIKLFLLVVCLQLFVSCGWQLRGSYPSVSADSSLAANDSKPINELRIINLSRKNYIYSSLKTSAHTLKIDVSKDALLTLVVEEESIDRRPIAYGSTGVPAQYQLILTIQYYYKNNLGEITLPSRTISSIRSYDFDIDLITAKSREEKELLDEMRVELALRVLASAKN